MKLVVYKFYAKKVWSQCYINTKVFTLSIYITYTLYKRHIGYSE